MLFAPGLAFLGPHLILISKLAFFTNVKGLNALLYFLNHTTPLNLIIITFIIMDNLTFPEPLKSLLDKLETKTITNFYGGPGTGKTCACLLALVECAKNNGNIIYIDTEGGLSKKRIDQLAQGSSDSVLQKVTLIEPKTFAEQGKVIRELESKNVDLIILDSAVALYRLEYAEPKAETIEANRELSKQLSILSNIARNKNIPILITAHTFKNWDTGENEIVGGNLIKYWSKAIIYLEKTGKTSERRAILNKHRSLPEGKDVKFMLVEEGIRPSGFRLF